MELLGNGYRWTEDERKSYDFLTTFDENTDIFINALVEKYKSIESKRISEKSIRELCLAISQINSDINEIRQLNNDIARRLTNYVNVEKDVEAIQNIIDKYKGVDTHFVNKKSPATQSIGEVDIINA